MGIKITIPNTSSDTLTFGSANTTTAAQIAGIDSGSTNGQMAFYTTASGTSTERIRVDSSGNVGIGTNSPSAKLHLYGATDQRIRFENTGWTKAYQIGNDQNALSFYDVTAAAERMRIDSSGNLLVGTTTALTTGRFVLKAPATTNLGEWRVSTNGYGMIMYNASDTQVGYISINASTTTYNTGSDYRLKENIAPMTGALAKVAQLKPCTFTWKATGENGQGFIAHELSEVVPDAVSGEKDAVDAEGNPRYQGIDTSFLVATLTAAIKEQQALIQTLTDRITALENK